MMHRFLLHALACAALAAAAGCGSSSGAACGPGTVLVGHACVPLADGLSCGPGTTLDGGLCWSNPAADAGGNDTGAPPDTAGADAGTDGAIADVAADAVNGDLACEPSCIGKTCGDNGCGGSCGSCTSVDKPTCNTALGVCVATCVPQCNAKNCGDDGCGGTCGSCAAGLSCKVAGRCVPDAWTCDGNYYAAGDACDCSCGAYDPDCKDPTTVIAGCQSLETCDGSGTCVSSIPAAWTCAASLYNALDACDCACGAYDPDCKVASLPVHGCGGGESCAPDGSCAACVPVCTGKTCGDDGCGGSCGACGAKTVCDAGSCVGPCSPKPIACKYNSCGDDGCGGTCGTCPSWATCKNGACEAVALPEAPTSCVGHCGSITPAGCYCTASCTKNGTCCKDYAAICSCKPDCTGKTCGSDGCGGSCGSCGASAPYCGADQQCTATCTPKCDGKSCGDDGCGGTCGVCGADAACSTTLQCIPKAWFCPTYYFADGQACDCGCGAPDPDCADSKSLVFGCPASNTACEAGLCKVAFCAKDSVCAANQWCTGVYAAGKGNYQGVCGTPDGSAKAPGQFCAVGTECASGVCLGGLCRSYCQADADCPGSQKCLGAPVKGETSSATIGFAGVCQVVAGSGAACTAQANCKAPGEICEAFIDAVSVAPRYLCATGSSAGGAACGAAACPAGQICVSSAKGAFCGLTCPGGTADCQAGASCGSAMFNNHGTLDPADDPTVAVCVPK